MDGDRSIVVEVAWAARARQVLLETRVAEGTTALQAVRQSGILAQCPEIDAHDLDLGIFGVPARHDQVLRPGDRVEIYRPLKADPRNARRRLAAQGSTIGARHR